MTIQKVSSSLRLHPCEDVLVSLWIRGTARIVCGTISKDDTCVPVVPPKSDIKKPWRYDKEVYKQRNQIERLFHHLKNFRRVATRYDKLDTSFRAFVALGLTMLMLRCL